MNDEAELRDRRTGRRRHPAMEALRSRTATLVWLVAVACALVLAVGALLVALQVDAGTAVVAGVEDAAKALDLGMLRVFDGADAPVENRLTSWGAAALLYLLVGKIADWVIRP